MISENNGTLPLDNKDNGILNKKPEKMPGKLSDNAAGLLRLAIFFAVFLLLFFCLQYLLAYDKDSYTRVMMHELYHPEENIDVLFLGSSHAYRQYIPSIIDKYMDVYSFNAGSSAQHLDGSCALLKEAGKRNELSTVFVELCPSAKGQVFLERTSFTETYIIADYMHWGSNKVDFLLHAGSSMQYVNSFFPLLRNKEKYLEPNYIREAIALKFDKDYQNYSHPGNPEADAEWYVDRGYVANNMRNRNENWKETEMNPPIKEQMFSEDELRELNRITAYCSENNIRLIFISTPITDFSVSLYGNYDDGRRQIADYAENRGVEFYDFNLCRPEYFTYESELFRDSNHMNLYGAEKYSDLLGRFFSGQIDEEKLFYGSYDDKLSEMGNRVFGLLYSIEETDAGKKVSFDPVASSDFTVYANIIKKGSDGTELEKLAERETLQDIYLDSGENGRLSIEILGDSPNGDVTNIITIKY